ncbi:MAG: hypothetical protein AAF085_10775 [Planctomycetota bacterium]
MKLSLSCLLALLLTGLSPSALAQATAEPVSEQDKANFKELFSEKLSTVNRTRTISDDRTLAQEMMAFASSIPDDPGVQCLIYIETIPLASTVSDIEMMSEAMRLLDERWPGHPATSVESQLEMSARAYRAVPRSERGPVGEAYINLLMNLVEHSYDRGDLDEAINIGRLANTIARAIDSEQRERVSQELERLGNESALNERIQMLTISVQKNPQNSPAARELVYLLVKKRNNPAAAMPFIGSTDDPELADLVTHASKGVGEANAAVAMRLGDWYRMLAEDEADIQAEMLLSKAQAWYERFFDLYPRDDALASRTRTLSEVSKLRLTALRIKLGLEKDDNAGWTDLIKEVFDPEKHAFRGEVRVYNNEIQCRPCRLIIPVEEHDAYELEFSFAVQEHEDLEKTMGILIPVGERYIGFRYNYTGAIILRGPGENMRHSEPERGNDLRKTRYLRFLVQLREEEAEADEDDDADDEEVELVQMAKVTVKYEDEEVMVWNGEVAELESKDDLDLREDAWRALRLRISNSSIIETIKYRPYQSEEKGEE